MAMYNEITVTAELTNTEYMITKNYNLLQNKPQINSVELTGNKSLEDLGINPDAEENVIDTVKVNGAALTPDENKAVNVTVTTGSDNGTVKVNGSDVAVKGLKSAAFTEATAYDAAGSAAEVQGNVDALTVVVNGKVDKVQGKGLSQNDFTNAYKTKLDGIEAGAQVNTVTSVAGKTGAVTLQKSDVGLGNVDNTSDLNKPISTATQTALNGKVDKETGKGLSTNDYTTADKTKLAGIEAEANKTIVDSAISGASTNPVQNKVIYDFINNLLPEKTASGNPISISDASGFNAKSAKITMLPIQDLHGQDAPYPAGGGKNKIELLLASLKTANTSGTWVDNVYTINNVAFTVMFDDDGNVNGIKANGTANGNANFVFPRFNNGKVSYTLSGCPIGGADDTYNLNAQQTNGSGKYGARRSDNGNSVTFTDTTYDYIDLWIRVYSGVQVNNLIFKPMLCLSSASEPTTFAPYSNICPISGRDSLVLNQCGKNVFDLQKYLTDNNISYTKDGEWFIFSIGSTLYNNKFTLPELAYYSGQLIIDNSRTVATNVNLRTYKNGSAVTQGRTFTNQQIDQAGLNYSTTGQVCCKIQVEYGQTTTEYKPYQGQTHTATFPDTVYGGSYDFVSGKATVDKKFVSIDGSENWVEYPENSGKFYCDIITPDEAKVVISGTEYISSLYLFEGNGETTSGNVTIDKKFYGHNRYGRFWVYDSDYVNDLAGFKTMLNTTPLQICYPLTTPQEITLTPETIALLKGNNVITTDGDNAEVKYSVSLDRLPT